MTPKRKTKNVSKADFANYLKKSEECLHAAQYSLQKEEWNSSAISAIHSCISACDAICVYYLGKRHSGENHNDAAALFKSIKHTDEFATNANRIVRVLRMKNMAEYEERLVYQKEAQAIVKDCVRFLEFVEKKVV